MSKCIKEPNTNTHLRITNMAEEKRKPSSSSASVQVAVRMRCFIHAYEIDKKTGVPHPHVKKIVHMDPPSTVITHPDTGKEHTFTYDYSYDSSDPKSDNYASQETVWNDLGTVVLDNAWDGYNVTLFAYGQTGSGKSYSMTGGNTPDSVSKFYSPHLNLLLYL